MFRIDLSPETGAYDYDISPEVGTWLREHDPDHKTTWTREIRSYRVVFSSTNSALAFRLRFSVAVTPDSD